MPTAKGPVRARDLRAAIKEQGFENGMVNTLEALLDEYAQTRQHLRTLTTLLDQCIDLQGSLMRIGESTTQAIDALRREQDQGNAIDHGNPGD